MVWQTCNGQAHELALYIVVLCIIATGVVANNYIEMQRTPPRPAFQQPTTILGFHSSVFLISYGSCWAKKWLCSYLVKPVNSDLLWNTVTKMNDFDWSVMIDQLWIGAGHDTPDMSSHTPQWTGSRGGFLKVLLLVEETGCPWKVVGSHEPLAFHELLSIHLCHHPPTLQFLDID